MGDGTATLIETIRGSVIGDDEAVAGPSACAASPTPTTPPRGRSLDVHRGLPARRRCCRSTPTRTPSRRGTGLQTTRFREEARRIIRDGRRRRPTSTSVIFCGSGSTAAIDKLVDVLNLRLPADLDDRYDLRAHIPPDERPVVFIGPYEHHSNELPWRESIADVVTIHEDADGRIDLAAPRGASWSRYADRPLKIGSFSAASNVTGILTDTRAISRPAPPPRRARPSGTSRPAAPVRRHRDGASTGRRRDPEAELDYKDAIFLSPHKFIGGPGTPGVLVAAPRPVPQPRADRARRRHRRLRQPEEHVYLADPEHREEGGTPAIVESIRAGLVFQLKERGRRRGDPRARGVVHPPRHRALERRTRARDPGQPGAAAAVDRLASSSATAAATCTTTSSSRCSTTCSASSRAAAAPAPGPYGHRLLGIDLERSHAFEREIARGCEGIKPGWVRVNFNYFISEAVFEYILDAVELVARDGWRLLPQYRFDPPTGLWRHAAGLAEPPLSLHDIRYVDGAMRYAAHRHHAPESRLADHLAEARALLAHPPPRRAAWPARRSTSTPTSRTCAGSGCPTRRRRSWPARRRPPGAGLPHRRPVVSGATMPRWRTRDVPQLHDGPAEPAEGDVRAVGLLELALAAGFWFVFAGNWRPGPGHAS